MISPLLILLSWHIVVSGINKNSLLISYPVLGLLTFRIIDRYFVQSKPGIFVQKHENYELFFESVFLEAGREYYFSIFISIVFCILGILTADYFIHFFSVENPLGVYDGFWGWLVFTFLSSSIIVACLGIAHVVVLMVFADMTKYEIKACQIIRTTPLTELFSGEKNVGDRAKFLKEFGHLELEWGGEDLLSRLKKMIDLIVTWNIFLIQIFAFFWWVVAIFFLKYIEDDLSLSSMQFYYTVFAICIFCFYNYRQHFSASVKKIQHFRINRLADEFSEEYRSLISKKTEEE